VQEPTHAREIAALDRLSDELDAAPVAPVPGTHVDVGEIRQRVAVRVDTGETDLVGSVVQANDARGPPDEICDHFAWPAGRPVGLPGQVPMDSVDVDAGDVVVELIAAGEPAPHRRGR